MFPILLERFSTMLIASNGLIGWNFNNKIFLSRERSKIPSCVSSRLMKSVGESLKIPFSSSRCCKNQIKIDLSEDAQKNLRKKCWHNPTFIVGSDSRNKIYYKTILSRDVW